MSTGDPSVVDAGPRTISKTTYAKPGNVSTSAWSTGSTGRPRAIVVLAKTSKGAARLSEQFRDGLAEKTYLAVAEGDIPEESGEWEDWLIKDERANVVSTTDRDRPGAHRASLAFRVLKRASGLIVVELRPTTGRGHQLRVQLASRGLPILGDRKYGADSRLSTATGQPRIALHALELRIKHPTRPEHLTIAAPLPGDWPASGRIASR